MTKDLMDAIRERRCRRRYKPDTIPNPTISRLLEAAQWAPSGGNIQPWHFFVIINETKRQQLSEAALGQRSIVEAPVAIVVCAIPSMSKAKYGERGERLYSLQDTAAAVQNILLAAEGFGLGTCWVGAFEDQKVREVLEINQEMRPVAIIPVGYYLDEEKENRVPPRRALEDIVTVIE